MRLNKLYKNRFNDKECNKKEQMWRILCKEFFQEYVNKESTVLDIGAGYCEFINNIKCSEKIAVDLNEDTEKFAATDVKVIKNISTDLSAIKNTSIDVVFMSNFLEHLKNKDDIIKTFEEANRVLKTGGRIMILQPNIRYLYKEYWDFFDHHTPISDKSLVEALQISGFKIDIVYPKFLPYTTKSKIPQKSFLIKLYLKLPIVWKIMGKQVFVLASK